MEKPKVAGNNPNLVTLEAGKQYAWCACGRSDNQPWCDGSHKGTGITPVVFKAEDNKKAAMCMCKQTKNPPFCDGSHNQL
jgi:CDGSH-type Zn-finger protein